LLEWSTAKLLSSQKFSTNREEIYTARSQTSWSRPPWLTLRFVVKRDEYLP